MGYSGKLAEKLAAQELRRQGLSYKEILQKIDVAKGTLSDWCKEIALTEAQQLRLLNNASIGQRKGSMVAANNKRNRRLERIANIRNEAEKEIGKLSKRDRFISGVALYAAEGNKSDRSGGFTNSDPKLIKFMADWFREFAKVPESSFRGAIWIHDGLDRTIARRFWSELTQIPEDHFHKTYIAEVKLNSKKIRKNIHQYGVFAVRFSHAATQRKIMGWIFALYRDRMSTT